MPLVNMYLTIGGVKIRVLGYTPEIFSLWPHAALWGLTLHTLSWHQKEATLLKQRDGLAASSPIQEEANVLAYFLLTSMQQKQKLKFSLKLCFLILSWRDRHTSKTGENAVLFTDPMLGSAILRTLIIQPCTGHSLGQRVQYNKQAITPYLQIV